MTSTEPHSEVLALRLELADSLSACADASNPLNARLRESVELGVGELLTSLGIPARPVVVISVSNGPASRGLLGLSVGEARVRYPDELLQRVYSYTVERPLDPLATPDKIAEWLRERCGPKAHAEFQSAIDFLALACVEILKREPATLFGASQARAYATLLPSPDSLETSTPPAAPDSQWLKEILDRVLVLGISIADRQTVASVLATTQPGARSPVAIAEDLVEALRPGVVEIQAPRAFLQELTTTKEDGPGMFPFLREGIFEELGLELPPFRFVAVDTLKPRTFRFKINHVASLPLRGLDPNQLLVNDTAERLALTRIEAVPTTNPATGQPSGLIDISAAADAQNLGLTTWTQLGHVVLCFADRARQYGHTVIHRGWVEAQLQKLHWVLPSLLATVRARWSDDEITGLLRDLVHDGVSVRNFRAILGSLVELDVARKRPDHTTRWRSHALDHPAAFVRIGLGSEIAYRAARQTNTVVVYLLDQAIERIVADSETALGEEADRILRAFHAEFALLPPTAQRPHVLTVIETRGALQELVRSEFPRLSVIAHEELPPGMNVQPIARMSLE